MDSEPGTEVAERIIDGKPLDDWIMIVPVGCKAKGEVLATLIPEHVADVTESAVLDSYVLVNRTQLRAAFTKPEPLRVSHEPTPLERYLKAERLRALRADLLTMRADGQGMPPWLRGGA